jgi:hypothetical protein
MTDRDALIGLIEYIQRDDYIEDAKLADWLELLRPSAQAADQQFPIEESLEARLDEYIQELRERNWDWREDDDDEIAQVGCKVKATCNIYWGEVFYSDIRIPVGTVGQITDVDRDDEDLPYGVLWDNGETHWPSIFDIEVLSQ